MGWSRETPLFSRDIQQLGIDSSWEEFFLQEFSQPYFAKLEAFLEQAIIDGKEIYPPQRDVFALFKLPFESIKVVILGQDPYHGPGQANGLAFSVQPGVKIPPSLRNIYQELLEDIPGVWAPQDGDLTHWVEQGVFLLNTALTVEARQANSHAEIGWQYFTDHLIQKINGELEGVVFLLWGAHAQKKGAKIDRTKHKILTAPHPSPLSAYRGFFGSKPFSKINHYLITQQKSPIEW